MADQRIVVKNVDTGECCNIDQIEMQKYNMFPSQQKKLKMGIFSKKKSIISIGEKVAKHFPYQSNVRKGKKSLPAKQNDGNIQLFKSIEVIQNIRAHKKAIWCVEFNICGDFFATSGEDNEINIWKIQRNSVNKKEQIFLQYPIQTFNEHSSDVVSLSWSPKNFLVSGSLDKTARLWHVDKKSCIAVFAHPGCVTSVSFSQADNSFLSGSTDCKLRLWNIDIGRVHRYTEFKHQITVVTISPKGDIAAVGLSQGDVYVIQIDKLNFFGELQCKNHHGKHRLGEKVTTLRFMDSGVKLLVSTNDSRSRIFCIKSFEQVQKLKGHVNRHMHIQSSTSHDDSYVTSGSEDGNVYIWKTDYQKRKKSTKGFFNTETTSTFQKIDSLKNENNSNIVTSAIFLPKDITHMLFPNECSSRKLLVTSDSHGKLSAFALSH